MVLGWEIVGRGPKPRFHRTMRPLPKAKPTGGSHGDAFPRPQTYPYGYRATSRDDEFDDWFSLPDASVIYFGQNHTFPSKSLSAFCGACISESLRCGHAARVLNTVCLSARGPILCYVVNLALFSINVRVIGIARERTGSHGIARDRRDRTGSAGSAGLYVTHDYSGLRKKFGDFRL